MTSFKKKIKLSIVIIENSIKKLSNELENGLRKMYIVSKNWVLNSHDVKAIDQERFAANVEFKKL